MRERDQLQDLDLQGRILLKRISKKWDGDMDWIDPAQDRGQEAGCCKYGNEPSRYTQCAVFVA
jgi:hypothetical protein